MKAVAVFPAERSVRLIDHGRPGPLAATEVLVRMLDVGICGTDREIARFDYGVSPLGSPYLIIGHESLGVVMETGDAVTHLRPGDLVTVMVRRPCDRPCPACAIGRPDFCVTGRFTERGIKGRHGFMVEEIVEEENFLIQVPPSLRSVGVLIEPLSIAEKAFTEVGDVQDRLPWRSPSAAGADGRGRALVLGAGPVGLLGTLALLCRDFETTVYSREPTSDPKAAWVKSVGARYVCSGDLPVGDLPHLVGNIDLIYEATGAADVAFRAMTALGANGVFIFTGVPGVKGPIALDADLIMRNLVLKNQIVYGTVNAGHSAMVAAVKDLLQFTTRWPAQVSALITERVPPEAYERLLLGPPNGIKRVVSFAVAS